MNKKKELKSKISKMQLKRNKNFKPAAMNGRIIPSYVNRDSILREKKINELRNLLKSKLLIFFRRILDRIKTN